jgi:hypothetical protein
VVRPSRVFEPVISFDDPILVPDRFGSSTKKYGYKCTRTRTRTVRVQ